MASERRSLFVPQLHCVPQLRCTSATFGQADIRLLLSHGCVFRSEWQKGQYSCLTRSHLIPGKIVAIGRNYADHVKELKNALPEEPFFFLKPTTSYLPSGGVIEIPRGIIAHHEGVFRIYWRGFLAYAS